MLDKQYSRQSIGTRLILLFFVMLAVGAFYVNIISGSDKLLLEEFAVHQKNMSQLTAMDWKIIFVHIWGLRMLQLLALTMLTYVVGMKCVLYLCIAALGLIIGILVSVETMLLGAVGMVYGIAAFLPQGIFYCAVFCFIYSQVKYEQKKYNTWRIRRLRGLNLNTVLSDGAGRIGMAFLKWVIVLALFTVGSLLEAYVNPHILLFCNQHLVPVIFM